MAFTDPTFAVDNVQQLQDLELDNAANVKIAFDKASADIKTYLTALNGELESTTDGNSGMDNIGMTQLSGYTATTPQETFEEMDQKIETLLPVPDNSITNDKLAQNIKIEEQNYRTIYMRNYESEIISLGINDFIQNKIDNGYNRFIVPTDFELTETLIIQKIRNNTGAVATGVVIEGEGGRNHVNNEAPVHFKLNTGDIGIELRETHSVTLRNLNIQAIGATPSKVGIVLTRDSTFAGSSISNTLENITLIMPDDLTANNNNGTIGIYNNTSEIATYSSLAIKANIPVVLTGSDVFNLCPTNAYSGSNLDHYFIGNNYFVSYGGANSVAMYIEKSENIVGNVYIYTSDNQTTSCAIKGEKVSAGSLNVNIENTSLMLNNLNGYIQGFEFNGLVSNVDRVVNIVKGAEDTGINACKFNLTVAYSGAKDYCYIGTGAYFSSNSITLDSVSSGAIFEYAGAFLSNLILSDSTPTITNSGGTALGNKYLTQKGIQLDSKRIHFSFNVPVDADGAGSVAFNTNQGGSTGSSVGWVHTGADYQPFGQVGVRQLSGSPVGVTTPKQLGEEVFDAVAEHWYKSTGLTNTKWKQITN